MGKLHLNWPKVAEAQNVIVIDERQRTVEEGCRRWRLVAGKLVVK